MGKRINTSILIFLFLVFAGCKKGEVVLDGPVTTEEINHWILDSMKHYYLWSQALPASANYSLSPIPFFNSVKYSSDNFSGITDPANPSRILTTFNSFGFDMSLINYQGTEVGVVRIVADNSPAASVQMKRGNFITRLDGTLVNTTNFVSLTEAMLNRRSGQITLAKINSGTGQLEETGTVTVTTALVKENPLYASRIFTVSGVKCGYLFYNAFDDEYASQVLQVLQDFKANGVRELILDLRYNPGGSIASSALIASAILGGIQPGSPFVQLKGNTSLGNRTLSFDETIRQSLLNTIPSFSTAAANTLQLQRIFVLTTPHTASASELLINALRPYIRVITIGGISYGKDKASLPVSDKRVPTRVNIQLNLIAYSLFNALGQGNYSSGISPQHGIDEFSLLPLRSIGSNEDPLIAKALSFVPDPQSGRVSSSAPLPGNNRVLFAPSQPANLLIRPF